MSELNYLLDGESEITIKNARRIILNLCDDLKTMKKILQKEASVKNNLISFIIKKGLLNEYMDSKNSNPVSIEEAIKTFAFSLE